MSFSVYDRWTCLKLLSSWIQNTCQRVENFYRIGSPEGKKKKCTDQLFPRALRINPLLLISLGLENGLKQSLKADFSDFATFSFVRQHLKFIEQDFICWCANSLPSCLKRRDTTFCSILWNTPPALPSWNVVFFRWGGHLFLQWEHSSAVWRLHGWWQRIKGGRW